MHRLKTKVKVEAYIELTLNFFTVKKIKEELGQLIGDHTPFLDALDRELYAKIMEVKNLFKDYE